MYLSQWSSYRCHIRLLQQTLKHELILKESAQSHTILDKPYGWSYILVSTLYVDPKWIFAEKCLK